MMYKQLYNIPIVKVLVVFSPNVFLLTNTITNEDEDESSHDWGWKVESAVSNTSQKYSDFLTKVTSRY